MDFGWDTDVAPAQGEVRAPFGTIDHDLVLAGGALRLPGGDSHDRFAVGGVIDRHEHIVWKGPWGWRIIARCRFSRWTGGGGPGPVPRGRMAFGRRRCRLRSGGLLARG